MEIEEKVLDKDWQVKKLGCINQELVDGSTCGKLAAKCDGMWQRYVIHRSDNICRGGSEMERPQSFWMQLSMHWNDTLAASNDSMIMIYNYWLYNDC